MAPLIARPTVPDRRAGMARQLKHASCLPDMRQLAKCYLCIPQQRPAQGAPGVDARLFWELGSARQAFVKSPFVPSVAANVATNLRVRQETTASACECLGVPVAARRHEHARSRDARCTPAAMVRSVRVASCNFNSGRRAARCQARACHWRPLYIQQVQRGEPPTRAPRRLPPCGPPATRQWVQPLDGAPKRPIISAKPLARGPAGGGSRPLSVVPGGFLNRTPPHPGQSARQGPFEHLFSPSFFPPSNAA